MPLTNGSGSGFGNGSDDKWIRIRILEAQKHVDPDPDPQHWLGVLGLTDPDPLVRGSDPDPSLFS
jgi:hypothetical protein